MAKVTTSYNNWDFNNQHVQQNLAGGDFVGSHTIILCASAPYLSAMSHNATGEGNAIGAASQSLITAGGIPGVPRLPGFSESVSMDATTPGFAIPLGVVSDIGLQQQRQINKIYEIGSKLSYTVSARTSINLNITRVLYHGPNLLRMLYAYYPESLLGGTNNGLKDMAKDDDTMIQNINVDPAYAKKLPKIKDDVGNDNIFINAASDLFSQPFGLVMYIKDNTHSDVAAIFIEDCNLVAHQFGISQNSVVIAEGVQITADRIRPLKVNVKSSQILSNFTQI